MELTIFLCTVSICICLNAVGGHRVSRCCITGKTDRSMRVYRRPAGILEATLEEQLPKYAFHIDLDVRCQHVWVEPLSWSA